MNIGNIIIQNTSTNNKTNSKCYANSDSMTGHAEGVVRHDHVLLPEPSAKGERRKGSFLVY